MKRVALVTGGAGFIGTNLVIKLLEGNWKVILYDNLSRKGSKENLNYLVSLYKSKDLEVKIGDVRRYADVKNFVNKADVVFHLAAQVAVTTSVVNPRDDFEVNGLGTLNVLEAARASRHNPIIIYSSTNKVYGEINKMSEGNKRKGYGGKIEKGVDETFPIDFYTPYGCSKGLADQYTRDYFRIYGLPTIVFRQSCIYGPMQMGYEDQGWVAHFVISAILDKPLNIFGDGNQVRDLLFVDDLIGAYLKSVDKIKDVGGEIFNIGGGFENAVSVLQVISFLEHKMGKKIKIDFKKTRPGDQKIFISDNSKLFKKLSWRPRTPFKQGLDKLYRWVSENKSLFYEEA